MKLTRSNTVVVTATSSGTTIGDQATLRGRKILGIVALTGKAPDGTDLVAPSAAYITLVNASGQIIHENLPMGILLPTSNGGLVQQLGEDVIDWTKSTVRGSGTVAFSVIHD